MAWFKRTDGQYVPKEGEESNLSDIEFKPEKLKEEITTSFNSKFDEFKTAQEEQMKPLQEMATLIKQEREERLAREVAAKNKTKQEESEITPDEYLLDPESAFKKQLAPRDNALYMLASREAIRETLEDKKYFYGEVKSKFYKYLEGVALKDRANPATILNCYKLAEHDHWSDISEGKIKARNTSTIFEGGSTGGHSGGDKVTDTETLSADESAVAKAFGMTEKDYAKSRKELSYV